MLKIKILYIIQAIFYKTQLCIKKLYFHSTKKLTYRHIVMPLAMWTKLARQFYFSGRARMIINTFRMLAHSHNSTDSILLPPWVPSGLLAASEAEPRGRNAGFWGLRDHPSDLRGATLCLFSKSLYLSLNSVFLVSKMRQRWRWRHWLEIDFRVFQAV